MNSKTVNIADIIGKGYGQFWRFKGRYRVVKGSRASKKSKTTALNLIYRIMQYPQANALVVRKTYNTLRDSAYSDLQFACARLGVSHLWKFKQDPLQAVYTPTGQTIYFRGLDDPQKLASISCPVGVICWVWVEEAFEIENEADFDMLDDTIRGELPDGLFKQITLTFNPWSQSSWLKRRFFDVEDENILALTTTYRCNEWLDDADLKRFEMMQRTNPTRFRVAGNAEWGVDGGIVFEEWRDEESHYRDRQYTHVIAPFVIPEEWRIYRGFDFGYAKPFSVGWWAVDNDGRLYRIAELYGCTAEPNTGVKWSPDEIFREIKRIEEEHPLLKGKHIYGVADPSIWDASRGVSVAEMAEKQGVYFEPGDNHRISGWMQLHYRLRFDDNGIPMMYIFNTCKQFIRTMPTLKYDKVRPEDVDTSQEDHIADETRYICMCRPISPKTEEKRVQTEYDPLQTEDNYDRYDFYRMYQGDL